MTALRRLKTGFYQLLNKLNKSHLTDACATLMIICHFVKLNYDPGDTLVCVLAYLGM